MVSTLPRKEKHDIDHTTPPASPSIDLLLTGGRVLDPQSGTDASLDVAIAGDTIVQIAPQIPSNQAQQVLDVRGYYVTPGLIDLHTHVYLTHGRSRLSIPPDFCLNSGVTTVVDTGTSGWRDFPGFKEQIIDQARVRIFAFVNIVGKGMGGPWEQDVREMDPHLAAAVATAYSDVVVGIKTAHYWAGRPFDADHPPWAAVDRALVAGELCHKPVMVDFWPALPERPYPTLLAKLRPGDIHTHVFAQQFPLLDDHGLVQPFMWKARERGIHFDLGHGAASFWYRIAAPAVQQGFLPDTISTDLHTGNITGPVFDLQTTMSKCLALGLPLTAIIERVTWAPAQVIGHPELGRLAPGGIADIAVFRLREHGQFPLSDCGKALLTTDQALECVLTIRAGRIVANRGGVGLPLWQEAPDAYWWDPVRRCSTRPSAL